MWFPWKKGPRGGERFSWGEAGMRLVFPFLLLRMCFCFRYLLSPSPYGTPRWDKSWEWRGTRDVILPTPAPFLTNLFEPWFHVSLTQGFTSHFQWNAPFGQATKKSPHYKLGNVWKENYLPKAALNQCCPNIYLAHTRRSCVNVCQRM